MVRKLLSIVALTLMVFGVQAQTLQMDPAANFHKTLIRRAPARVASLEGTTAYGYGTETDWQGLGVNASGVTFDVAIYVPAGAAFRNATINGINIPVLDTAMKDVSAWIRSDIYDDNDLAKATAAGPFKANEYFSVAFDEPVPVPEEGFYAGYTFTCSINYPVAMGAVYAENGILLQYTNNGQASGWGDYSSQFPASPLQVFISGISLPDYSISLSYVGQSTQLTNSTYSIPVDVVSSSAKAIENVDVAVTVEGKTEQKHITLPEPIETGLNKSASFIIEGTSPAEPGRYEANIVIEKVNGTEYEEPATGVGLLKNLTKKVKRNTVIEEFTGTGCGWCPRGWAGMEYMKENYPDNFIGIAFHKYNSTDPMYYANYPYLGLTGAPGCIVDRKIDTDPYYGHVDNDLGIAETFGILNSELPEVDVKAVSHWEQDGKAVKVTANVEFLVAPGNVSLVYVLTADSLSGSATSWRQTNYYAQYSASDVGNAPGITDFCKGGKYGSSPVKLVFNDVVISSSYDASSNNLGQSISEEDGMKAGSIYQGEYTLSMPTKASLRVATKSDLVFANVLVVDDTTGEILNATRTKIEPIDGGEDAVDRIQNSSSAVSTRYNAAGQVIAAPQRGLNIIRLSDGKVRKVMVK
ncbi:MAG: hypothetical protein IJT19_09955 [Bacteroidaceae bacterium]|nr:hypothetical protein [Bacteroidaceae bacterium]